MSQAAEREPGRLCALSTALGILYYRNFGFFILGRVGDVTDKHLEICHFCFPLFQQPTQTFDSYDGPKYFELCFNGLNGPRKHNMLFSIFEKEKN